MSYYKPKIDEKIDLKLIKKCDFNIGDFLKGKYKYAKEDYGDNAYQIDPGIWSPVRTILNCGKDGKDWYWVNLSRGSFPNLCLDDLKERFKFYKLTPTIK